MMGSAAEAAGREKSSVDSRWLQLMKSPASERGSSRSARSRRRPSMSARHAGQTQRETARLRGASRLRMFASTSSGSSCATRSSSCRPAILEIVASASSRVRSFIRSALSSFVRQNQIKY